MRIRALHSNFIIPEKKSDKAGAFDIYMPEAGSACGSKAFFGLGFSAAVPEGHVALILPRSGIGTKFSLELNNTCGVIDSDYRGEWMACLRIKDGSTFEWSKGDRLLQFMVVPIANVELEMVDELNETDRGTGGFGSTGR